MNNRIVTSVILLDQDGNELRHLTPEEVEDFNAWSALYADYERSRTEKLAALVAKGNLLADLDRGAPRLDITSFNLVGPGRGKAIDAGSQILSATNEFINQITTGTEAARFSYTGPLDERHWGWFLDEFGIKSRRFEFDREGDTMHVNRRAVDALGRVVYPEEC